MLKKHGITLQLYTSIRNVVAKANIEQILDDPKKMNLFQEELEKVLSSI